MKRIKNSVLKNAKLISIGLTILSLIICVYKIYKFTITPFFYDHVIDLDMPPTFTMIVTYSIGALIGTAVVPIISWMVYGFLKYKNNRILKLKKQDQLSEIENSSEVKEEFLRKKNTLNELLKLNAISIIDYQTKMADILSEATIKVKYFESTKTKELQLLKLKEALDLGVITLDEYSQKLIILK